MPDVNPKENDSTETLADLEASKKANPDIAEESMTAARLELLRIGSAYIKEFKAMDNIPENRKLEHKHQAQGMVTLLSHIYTAINR